MDTDQSTQTEKDFLHDQYGVVVMFLLIPATLLWACLNPDIYWMILLPVLIILAYDLHFRFAYRGEWALRGRDYESTLHGIRAAIQYTSILIGFIGIVLSGFFEKDLINAIGAKLSESGLLKCYTMALVAIPTFMLLFIPVTYTQSKIDTRKMEEPLYEPSVALKNYYFLILLLQKVLIILSVYMAFVVFDVYMKLH